MNTLSRQHRLCHSFVAAMFAVPLIVSCVWTGYRMWICDTAYLQTAPTTIVCPEPTGDVILNLDQVIQGGQGIVISGWAVLPREDGTRLRTYIVLVNGNERYAFLTYNVTRTDVTTHFRAQDVDVRSDSGFECALSPSAVKPGKYVIGVMLQSETCRFLTVSSESIQFTEGAPQ